MMRIKGDKSSGKDKAKYLKSLRDQQKLPAVQERAKAPVIPGRQLATVMPTGNKPVMRVSAAQLVAASAAGDAEGEAVNEQPQIPVKAVSDINADYGDDDDQPDYGMTEAEPSVSGNDCASELPAGFFDEEVANTSTIAPGPTSDKAAEEQLHTLLNELDNMPADEEDDIDGAGRDGVDDEAVQLAYETKLARLLQKVKDRTEVESPGDTLTKKRTNIDLDASSVLDEADRVLMHYTSSVLDDVSDTAGASSSSANVPQSSITSEVQAALARKKKKRLEVATSHCDYSAHLDLMDWTAKNTR